MTDSFRTAGRALLAIAAFVVPTIFIYRAAVDVARPYPATSAVAPQYKDTVYVGVISRYPSSVLYRGYQPMMDYLSRTTGRYFALRLSGSYEETVQQLAQGKVTAAFIGAYLYVKAHEADGVVSVLQPLNADGTARFRSVVLSRDDSDIRRIDDLRHRKVALPPPLSFSANWLLNLALPGAGLDSTDLALVHYLPNHHAAVYELLRGRVDVAVVKDRVAQEFRGRGVRVVASSEPIPGGPIVVAVRHDTAIVNRMADALLALTPRDSAARLVMSTWDPEFAYGFTRAPDADYDGLRALLKSRLP